MLNELLYILGLSYSLNFNSNVKSTSHTTNIRTFGSKINDDDIWLENNITNTFISNNKNNHIYFNSISSIQKGLFYSEIDLFNLLESTCSIFSRGLNLSNYSTKSYFIDSIPDSSISYELLICSDNSSIKQYNPTCVITNCIDIDFKDYPWIYHTSHDWNIISKIPLSLFIQRKQLNQLEINIISLHSRIQRRELLKKELDQCNIPYTIQPAISGKQIHIGIFDQQSMNRLKSTSNIIQIAYYNRLYYHDTSIRPLKLSYGEIGCALSHLDIYDHCMKLNKPILVFEDDAKIDNPVLFLKQLHNLPSFKLWDLCYMQNDALWYTQQPLTDINSWFGLCEQKGSNRTHCYIITPSGAKKAIQDEISKTTHYFKDQNNPGRFINIPSDDYLSRKVESGILTTISPYERTVSPRSSQSDIWSIYKPNEDYRRVVWDKPIIPPSHLVINDMGDYSRLGNQMFHYAMAWCTALKKNTKIVLPENRIQSKQITLGNIFKHFWYDKQPLTSITEVIQEDNQINIIPTLLTTESLKGTTILKGYYQSSEYFKGMEDIVRELFIFKDNISFESRKWIQSNCGNKTPISIHIRLPDIEGENMFIYHTWSPEELLKCISYFKHIDNPIFLIHSSNFKECRKIYKEVLDTIPHLFVDKDEGLSLAIMASCKYHIISASSYSWWGSWLSSPKQVVAPKSWYNPKVDRVKDINTSGLYMPEWILV